MPFRYKTDFAHSLVSSRSCWKSVRIYHFHNVMLLLFTRPLPRDGGMAEDHGAPEAGQLPRVWTRGHKETESRQRVSGAKNPKLDSAE